ncbi:DUF2793 domain-containing protein [Xanthobacter sp. TB0139]|uniref:DUF2793 domain-containing protein n=1 Tax=Xanthobacter sp. TB0139 TaxID=3459178 RepID=UPI004039DFE9
MFDQSARLGLPYLAASQAQKHVTHNEALRRLDALVHLSLESITTQAPPGAPAEGQCWFVPEGAAGAFAGHEGQLACWEAGVFDFLDLPDGAQAFIRDEWRIAMFARGGWGSPLASTPGRAAIEARVVAEDVVLSGAYTETRMTIPARAIVLGVSTRTLSPVTGASAYDCGVAAEGGKFGSALSIQHGASNAGVIGPTAFYAPTPIRLTAQGGAFTGGRVRVGLHYLMCPVARADDEENWWLEPGMALDGAAPVLAADFVRERYVQDGAPCAADALFTRSGGSKWVSDAHGACTQVPANVLAFDYSSGRRRMVLEGAATNLFIDSAAPTAPASLNVSAQAYTLSFIGTGLVTLSGAHAASLAGGEGNVRSSLTFTPSDGMLTLTTSGDVRKVQLEAGSLATSYIETTTSQATRISDICALTPSLLGRAGPGAVAWRGDVRAVAGSQVMIGGDTVHQHGAVRANGAGTRLLAILPTQIYATAGPDLPGYVGVVLAWNGDDVAFGLNGMVASNASSATDAFDWSTLYLGGFNLTRHEIDEFLIWPVRGSDAGVKQQARAWA